MKWREKRPAATRLLERSTIGESNESFVRVDLVRKHVAPKYKTRPCKMASGMTFRGFDGDSAQLILRGPFGKSYLLSTDAERLSPFTHAATILHPRTGRQGTVLGALDDKLYVQFDDDTTATAFPQAQALVELELASPPTSSDHGAAEDTVEFAGPIGVSYRFNTRSLESAFEVRAGAQHYVKLWNCTVVFVGTFLRIPWVRVLGGDRASLPAGVTGPAARVPNGLKVALPLVGCLTAAALRNVYLLCEVPSGPSGPFISTPRALHGGNVTPALSAVKGVSDAPSSTSTPYRVNLAKHVAVCSGPLGATFEVDMGEAALKAFDTRHGERFMVLKGMAAGKLASVVGAQAGTLVVHVDGEPRVTVLRGCNSALDVSSFLARPKGGAGRLSTTAATPAAGASSNTASRVKADPPSRAAASTPAAGGGTTPRDEAHTDHRHSSSSSGIASASGKPHHHHSFRCWTAFGRFDFDTRESTIKKFGPFVHEQTVRCTVGPDRGKLFHIVGERNGSLWVVEDKRLRATPLAFCGSPADVQLRYGFVPHGRCSLRDYATQEEEPPPTPLRRSASKAGEKSSGPHADLTGRGGAVEGAGVAAAVAQGQAVSKPVAVNLVLEPAFTAAASSSPMRTHPTPGPELVGTIKSSSGVVPAADTIAAVTLDDGGSSQSRQVSPQATRNYLKAIAMFMLGTTNAKRTPLPFHEYYAADPTKRLSGALKKLDATRDMWNKVHPVKPFGGATTEDLLRLFAKFPQLLP